MFNLFTAAEYLMAVGLENMPVAYWMARDAPNGYCAFYSLHNKQKRTL